LDMNLLRILETESIACQGLDAELQKQ